MKKLPIIGLLVGAVAALFAMRKKKGAEEPATGETPPTGDAPSA